MRIYDILKEEVSIYDLFDISDPKITYTTKAKPCQISCPIHGKDAHPSARVYPDTNTFRCFTCSKSWNSVTYWAEVNGWFTEAGTLDIGHAINDLCARFNISDTSFDWERRFHALKKDHSEKGKVDTEEELHRLSSYYAWNIAKRVHAVPKEQRKAARSKVLAVWSDYDSIPHDLESWKRDLINWYRSAKVTLDGHGL